MFERLFVQHVELSLFLNAVNVDVEDRSIRRFNLLIEIHLVCFSFETRDFGELLFDVCK